MDADGGAGGVGDQGDRAYAGDSLRIELRTYVLRHDVLTVDGGDVLDGAGRLVGRATQLDGPVAVQAEHAHAKPIDHIIRITDGKPLAFFDVDTDRLTEAERRAVLDAVSKRLGYRHPEPDRESQRIAFDDARGVAEPVILFCNGRPVGIRYYTHDGGHVDTHIAVAGGDGL